VLGTVKKVRRLYKVGQTRIHLDDVENLGKFVELEVVMTPEQSVSDAEHIASLLMQKLEIGEHELISGAYLDMLRVKQSSLLADSH